MFSLANLYLYWKLTVRRPVSMLTGCNLSYGSTLAERINSIIKEDASITLRRKGTSVEGKQVIYENQNAMVYTEKRMSVCLDDWTLYLQSLTTSATKAQSLHIFLESSHPANEAEFITNILSIPPQSRVELLTVCNPHAWLSGEPFSIICRCTHSEFIRIAEAYVRNSLVMDELLQIDRISLVDVTGKAQELLPADSQDYLERRSLDDNLFTAVNNMSWTESPECSGHQGDCITQCDVIQSSNTTVSNTTVSDSVNVPETTQAESSQQPTSRDYIKQQENTVRQRHAPSGKSPNILIYSGKKFSTATFNELKNLCVKCLGTNSYTIYHLKNEQVKTTPWQENCHLLIIAVEQIYDGIDTVFTDYFFNGGKILSFCSNFDKNFLSLSENENCNQPKVVTANFNGTNINVVQGRYYYSDCDCLLPTASSVVIATNQLQQAVVIEISNPSGGCCIVTQLHLERSPLLSSVNSDMVTRLNATEGYRVDITRDLLSRLCIEGDNAGATDTTVSAAIMLHNSSEEAKNKLLDRVIKSHARKYKDGVLVLPNVAEINLKGVELPSSFNWKLYKDTLTGIVGNTLIYQKVTTSTQLLIEPFMFCCPAECGLVAIAQQQISGIGRGDNSWLSPAGCLAMSIHLKVDMSSNLGQSPALIQTIPAVAVARIIDRLLPQCDEVQVKVKWPNDIYYKQVKLGGVVVKSTILNQTLHAVVGLGVNVSNPRPTININDVIDDYNLLTSDSVQQVSVEYLAAMVCSQVEDLIKMLQQSKSSYLSEYYKYWMHDGGRVDVPQEGIKNALILGLDDYGFLLLRTNNKSLLSVQPDGNSFDIMHNLIKLK